MKHTLKILKMPFTLYKNIQKLCACRRFHNISNADCEKLLALRMPFITKITYAKLVLVVYRMKLYYFRGKVFFTALPDDFS